MALQQEIAKADHGGEKVIKVMRYAAGQLAHGLHFLCLGKLEFEVFTGSGVYHIDNPAAGRCVGKVVTVVHGADIKQGNTFSGLVIEADVLNERCGRCGL